MWVEFRLGGIPCGWNSVWVQSRWVESHWVEFRVGGISWVETRGWNPMGGISLGGIPRG